MRETWIGCALVRFERSASGVLVVRVAGVATVQSLTAIAREIWTGRATNSDAFMVDCRAAAVAASQDEILSIPVAPEADRNRPGAFVATPQLVPLLCSHAKRMALAGFWRRTFLDTGSAYEWLARRVSAGRAAGTAPGVGGGDEASRY